MKHIKKNKVFAYVLIGLLAIQASIAGYSVVNKKFFAGQDSQTTEQSQSTQTAQTLNTNTTTPVNIDNTVVQGDVDPNKLEISQEIQDIIKQQYPDNFDKNLNNYKTLLVNMDVHTIFKDEIERLLKNGNMINDILTAYEFLYDSYGKKVELEALVTQKKDGKAWIDIFKGYNDKNPEFVPRAFDPDYLEKLMSTQGISKDDIMIADRVASKAGLKVNDVMELRLTNAKWKVINASLGILNTQQKLPYVAVTADQVKKYISGKLTEEQVVGALVIANKFNAAPQNVVDMTKDGMSKEQIYAECLEAKYY